MQLDSGSFFACLLALWLVWRLLPAGLGKSLLLLASLAFYAMSSPAHAVFVAGLLLCNHAAARGLSRWPDHWRRHALFAGIVLLDVAVLVFFKWAAVCWSPALGVSPTFYRWVCSPAGHLAFPLGLSYIIFQMIACVTDVYRRQFKWNGGIGGFLLFGFFFPQVSSGPIPRAAGLMPQLRVTHRVSSVDLPAAISLIFFGLFKKFVVANRLNIFVGQVFTSDLPMSSLPIALGMVLNALQLYADFSGYTDIARGTAQLFGITLGQNFDRPLLSESVTDFWRRWHISLSSWLKDYLYLPLVIRLRGLGKTAIVISFITTFVICGLWHKVSWAFALFGMLHGLALAVEFLTKKFRKQAFRALPGGVISVAGWCYAFGFFALTMVLFRAANLGQACKLYRNLLTCSLPASAGEVFAYSGPVLFGLNFLALGCWYALGRMKDRSGPASQPWFVLACSIGILLLGKLPEGNFIYAQF